MKDSGVLICPSEKVLHLSLIFKCRDLSLSHLKWLCKPPVVPSVGVGKERGGLQPVKRHFHAFNFARAGPRVNAVRGGCLGLLKR